MEHPFGRCGDCGERVYALVTGGYRCPNCETRYPAEDEGARVVRIGRE